MTPDTAPGMSIGLRPLRTHTYLHEPRVGPVFPLRVGFGASSMNTPGMSSFIRILVGLMMIAVGGTALGADEPPGPPATPSKAQREQMAQLHEKMAACLRSDKDFAVCRDEMHSSCRDMMGEQACPMMGGGMHDQMMKNPPPPKPENK